MKFIIVFAAFFAIALAAPATQNNADVQVVRQESDVGVDAFNYVYETSDGTNVEASGQLKNQGTDDEALVVRGSFSYVADDGQLYTVNYIADENGFQPQGAHIPVAQ